MTTTATVRLPTYATSLIGRAADVAAITAHLRQPDTRMLTLVGSSGAGKTRLALESATTLLPHIADGVVFIALAPVQDPRFVLSTIAQALAIPERGEEPLLTTLGAALKDRQMALILDNIEQVRTIAPELESLLALAPRLQLLITSQVPLGTPHETIYPVPPLSVPAESTLTDPAAMLAYPAIALFVERLQAVQPRFQLSERQAGAVVRICQLLDGYPLAIELVAAHSAALAPTDLLLLLRNHLGVQGHQREVAASSRTAILNPVLDWCTSRLPALAQRLFPQLGIFLGGWRAEAAWQILAPETPAETVTAALDVLVQKHLVQVETLPGQDPRFVMLDAVRDYSASRLQRTPHAATIRQRHAAFYQTLIATTEPQLQGPQQAISVQRLSEEIHNIRLALQASLDDGQADETLRSVGALAPFWAVRSLYTEGRQWITAALQAAQAASLPAATAWSGLGMLAYRQGAYGIARDAYDHSLALARQLGDDHAHAKALNGLGGLLLAQGQPAQARTVYEQSLQLMRQVGDQHGRGTALNNLAFVSRNQGDYQQAQAYLEESLAVAEQAGNDLEAGRALLTLGVVHGEQDDLAAAQRAFTAAQARFEAIGDARNIGFCLANLGVLAAEQGDYAQARQHYETVLARYQAVQDRRGEAMMSEALGYLALLQDDWAAAATWLDRARQILEAIGEANHLMLVYGHQARLALIERRLTDAWALIQILIHDGVSHNKRPVMIEAAELAALALGDEDRPALIPPLRQAATAARATWRLPHLASLRTWYARHGLPIAADPPPAVAVDPGPSLTEALAMVAQHPQPRP